VATLTKVVALQSRLAAQLVEQHLGILEVRDVEALGEPIGAEKLKGRSRELFRTAIDK